MAKICYVERRFSESSVSAIDRANEIIDSYQKQGFRLTLRQLYYQFVSRGFIPNSDKEYKRLGSIINDARLAGLLDWDAIEDRGRNLQKLSSWSSPREIIKACASQYRDDLWRDQPFLPEVWVEKEALAGVVAVPADKWRVPYFACKGYVSQSEMWDAGANRFRDALDNGQKPLIIHLGDHDPSGIDMTRDIRERLELFLGEPVEVRRIALTIDQVHKYNPPPNPAKTTDARFAGYHDTYGSESWELDALDPTILGVLIEDEIRAVLDLFRWREATAREEEKKQTLRDISVNYDQVVDWLEE